EDVEIARRYLNVFPLLTAAGQGAWPGCERGVSATCVLAGSGGSGRGVKCGGWRAEYVLGERRRLYRGDFLHHAAGGRLHPRDHRTFGAAAVLRRDRRHREPEAKSGTRGRIDANRVRWRGFGGTRSRINRRCASAA